MSKFARYYFIVFTLCCSMFTGTNFLHGQSSISGTVITNAGDTAAFARVSLHLKEGGFLYKGTYADSTGFYSLDNIYFPDTLVLRVSQLGYAPFAKPVLLNGVKAVELNPVITTAGNNLPAALVKERRVAFTVRGDTISFNPQAYLVGNERTLGDLIKNIPELELTANGEVRFKGKKVTGVLVEGFDIFNGQQKSATEDFGIEHILSIDIIENYRGAGDFLSGETDRVMLDVKLKNGSKRKWIGRHELGVTPASQWKASSGITKASREQAINLKATTNSIGRAALNSKDYLNTKASLSDALGDVSGQFTLDDLLPKGILPPEGLTENKELMLSAGYDYRKPKKFSLKGSLMGVLGDRTAARSFERFVIDNPEQNMIAGDERSNHKLNFLFLNLRVEEKVSKGDSSAKFTALLDVNQDNTSVSLQQVDLRGTLDYESTTRPTNVSMRLQWRGSAKSVVNSKAYFNYSRDHVESSSVLGSNNPLRVVESDQPSQRIEQLSNRAYTRYAGALTQQVTTKRWWMYLESTAYHDRLEQTNTSASTLLLDKDGKADELGLVLDARLKWTEKKFSVTLTNESSLSGRSYSDSSRSFFTRKSSVFLKLRPHTFHYALLQVFNNELPSADLASSLGTYDIIDLRSVNFNNALPFDLQRTNGLALSYFNRNLFLPRLTLLTTLGASRQANGQLRVVVPRGDFFHYVFTAPSNARTFSFANRLMTPLAKGISLSWETQFNRTQQRNETFPSDGIAIQVLNNSLNIRVAKVGKFGFSAKSSWLFRKQTVLEQRIKFGERSVLASVKYTSGNFRASLEGGQRFSRISQRADLANALLNAEAAYVLGKGKWEAFLKGDNLLQLTPTSRLGNIATANEVESSQYTDFPGYVLIGFERLF